MSSTKVWVPSGLRTTRATRTLSLPYLASLRWTIWAASGGWGGCKLSGGAGRGAIRRGGESRVRRVRKRCGAESRCSSRCAEFEYESRCAVCEERSWSRAGVRQLPPALLLAAISAASPASGGFGSCSRMGARAAIAALRRPCEPRRERSRGGRPSGARAQVRGRARLAARSRRTECADEHSEAQMRC